MPEQQHVTAIKVKSGIFHITFHLHCYKGRGIGSPKPSIYKSGNKITLKDHIPHVNLMKSSWYEWEYAAFVFLIWPVLLNRYRSHVNLLLVLFRQNFLGPQQQEIESGKLGKCKNGTNLFCHHSEYGLAQTAQTAMKWKNDVVLFVCYVLNG